MELMSATYLPKKSISRIQSGVQKSQESDKQAKPEQSQQLIRNLTTKSNSLNLTRPKSGKPDRRTQVLSRLKNSSRIESEKIGPQTGCHWTKGTISMQKLESLASLESSARLSNR